MKNNILLFKTYIIIFISLMTLNIFFLYSSLLSFDNFITYFPLVMLYFPLSFYSNIKKITNINFFNLFFLKFDNILSRKEIFTLDFKRHAKLLHHIIEDHYQILISDQNYFQSLISNYNEKSLTICSNVFTIRDFIFKHYFPFINSLSDNKKADSFFNYMLHNLNFYQFSEEEFKNIIEFKFFSVERLHILNQFLTKKEYFNLLIQERILFIEMNNF